MEDDPLARITHRLEYFDNLASSEDADWLLWQVRDGRERITQLQAALRQLAYLSGRACAVVDAVSGDEELADIHDYIQQLTADGFL